MAKSATAERDPRYNTYEIPQHLDISNAVWYYEHMTRRRGEVYQMYFARLRSMDEWLEVYNAASDNTRAKALAIEKLAEMELTTEQCAVLYEARGGDRPIAKICEERLEAIAGGKFEKWRELFDSSRHGSDLRSIALNKMRPLAQGVEDWRDIYDRTDLGSRAQIEALQNMLLLFRADMVPRVTAETLDNELVSLASSKTSKEWREECEKYNIYNPASEIAAINIYVAADLRMEEMDKSREQNRAE